jgi:8-oxo-dGTP pyrophosphatase MutT (NUDIX family)
MLRVRASVVCWQNDKLLAIQIKDPVSGQIFITVPGGQVEADETAPEAAARETKEETGFLVEVDPTRCIDAEYLFFWKGAEIECLTMFYKASLKSPFQQPVEDAEYILGIQWIERADLRQVFAYNSTILDAILSLSS